MTRRRNIRPKKLTGSSLSDPLVSQSSSNEQNELVTVSDSNVGDWIKKEKKKTTATKKSSKIINQGKPVDVEVKRGNNPWEFKIEVAKFNKRRTAKIGDFDNTLDFSNEKKLYVTEKREVADTIKEVDSSANILNLGGNPFYPIGRMTASKNNPIRKSNKELIWRGDKAYSQSGFQYPIVNSDTQIIVISDNDYLGQYWNYQFGRLMNIQTSNIKQYSLETNDSEVLRDVLDNKLPKYNLNKKKAIAGTFYFESLSEIGGTLISSANGKDGIWDTFTTALRGPKSWSEFRGQYFQGANSLNFTYADLSLLQKVKTEQLSNKQRIHVYLNTESDLEEFELVIPPMRPSSKNSYYDSSFQKIDERTVNIKNTDDTVLLLVDKLRIEPNQSEDLIKRLATQNILSYPRTEYEGISSTQKYSSDELADIWLYYHPEYSDKRAEIINGISDIKTKSGESPKSGILVTAKTDFDNETIQAKVVNIISQANIQAALGAREIEGYFVINEKDSDGKILNRIKSDDTISIITTNPKSVGTIADIKFNEKIGMTDRELYSYLADNELGTIATRSQILNNLQTQGLLLKYKGEYKLDDRSRILINTLEESNFDSIKANEFLKSQRSKVENNSNSYQIEKTIVYNTLSELVKKMKNHEIQQNAIQRFKRENQQLEQIDEIHQLAIEKDLVEIE